MLTKTVSFSTSKETFQSQFENNNGDMRNSYNIERRNWYHFATNPQLHYSARVQFANFDCMLKHQKDTNTFLNL